MTTVERSVFINAPADAVSDISTDPSRLPEWYSGIERAEPDGVFPERGGKVAVTYLDPVRPRADEPLSGFNDRVRTLIADRLQS